MYYDKRIRYLSYYESGIKLQNAGYVKFQVRDSLCQMVIYVKGPRLVGSGEARVYLLSEKPDREEKDGFYREGRKNNLQKHFLGTLSIRNGQGYCAVRLHAENMADSGLWYDEICGIKIELHEYQYLESQWTVVNVMPGQRKKEEEPVDTEPVEVSLIVTPVSENLKVEKVIKEKDVPDIEVIEGYTVDIQETEEASIEEYSEAIPETSEQRAMEDASDEEESMQDIFEREVLREETAKEMQAAKPVPPDQAEKLRIKQAEQAERNIEANAEEEIRLVEQELQPDKWEQLRQTYPIVHPIREEEEYLKITPKDFVVFTEKYQELVHNSFLLHGYYNYKHLILGKRENDGNAAYYLGVPGTFHEREKAVAVMFGFEAFDGKREPAQTGDFGYYLRRVEI